MAGEHDRDEDGPHHVGKDPHAVLRHLSVGDALHATHHRVEEHQRHADDHSGGNVHFQEAAEYDTDTAHLTGHVGERNEDRAHHRDQTRGIGVVTITNEVGHGELAELAQVQIGRAWGGERGCQYV